MTEEEYYQNLFNILNYSKNFVEKSSVLSSIFDAFFWDCINKQIGKLKQDRGATIHPIYNLLLKKDVNNDFRKMKQLECYLNLIFQHPTVNKENKEYVKSELRSFNDIQSLNILFEVSVLGRILSQVPRQKIVLYPHTCGRSNIDLKVRLLDRDIYIEVTCLGTSKYHRAIQTLMIRSSTYTTLLTGSIPKDLRRIEGRIREKESQFLPGRPNIVFLFSLGNFPIPPIQWAIENLSNIGSVVGFDRGDFINIFKEGCDSDCSLLKEEENKLINLFDDGDFCLIY